MPWTLAFLVAGCSADDSPSTAPNGFSGAQTPAATPGPAPSPSTTGAAASSGGASTSGTVGATDPAPANSEGTELGAGGSVALDPTAGETNTGTGGSSETSPGMAGAASTGAGGAAPVGVVRTVDLIGPDTAACGATNATHGDGFVCVLNYPNEGPNVVGYWFDYAFTAGTCNLGFTKPTGNADPNPRVCFSGSACPATSGGGLGVALCDVHGIDVSTWPELQMLETTSSLSSTLKSPVSGCNSGATISSISWTLGSGSIPAGASVLFDDAADVTVARIDNLAAGATSVELPANVDASQVATIKFSMSGATIPSWDFCLTDLTVSMR